jgi:membrane protease YdiL (CAAX protease family)
MEQHKDIIEFEDLFKEERNQRHEENDPHRKQNYWYAILVYFLIMQVAAILFYLAFMQFSQLTVDYTENELILYEVASNENALAVLETGDYQLYEDDFKDQVVSIGNYQGYEFIVNIENDLALTLFFFDPEATLWNEEAILAVFSSLGEVTWDADGETIDLVAGKDQVLPDFFTAEAYLVDGPVNELSRFAFSLLNFSIYIILLPVLLVMMKRDLILDWNKFKEIKPMWFQIIAVGYLYLFLGNIVAGYLQSFLSELLGVIPSISVNQLSIQNALTSNGAIFMIIAAVILGPIIEELIFRKAIFGLIRNDKIALATSTFVFGAIHLLSEGSIAAGLVNGIAYFTMGLIFGYIYLKNDKNIIAPIAIHILSNLISIILILFIY